jgi:hypothetical protein
MQKDDAQSPNVELQDLPGNELVLFVCNPQRTVAASLWASDPCIIQCILIGRCVAVVQDGDGQRGEPDLEALTGKRGGKVEM